MFERFTTAARQVVVDAKAEATELQHRYVGTEHLLLALLRPDSGLPATLLTREGITAAAVRRRLTELAHPDPAGETPHTYDTDAAALRAIGINLDEVRTHIDETYGKGTFDSLSLEATGRPALDANGPPALDANGRPATDGPARLGRRLSLRSPFNKRSRKVLELSLREAIRLHTRAIGAEHILLGIIREGDGRGAQLLTESGVDLNRLRDEIVASITTKAA